MSAKAGVWIDHKQAVLVLIAEEGQEIKRIASGIGRPSRSGSNNPYTPNDFVAEDRLERKHDSHLKNFYDEVISGLRGSEALLILGPGEAKDELHKRFKSKRVRGLSIELETADRMTDRQLAAKVAQHFAAIPVKNSVSPTKTPKTKTPKRKTPT
jgi:hypothetical protein